MFSKRPLATPLIAVFLITSFATAKAQSSPAPAQALLQRLMPHLAPPFQLALTPRPDGKDHFRITGTRGHIQLEAAPQPTVLYGVN